MTHEDAGHYAAKHPDGKTDPAIADAIDNNTSKVKITCAAAHKIAEQLNVTPETVGMNVDLLEKRISKCQLGLFGYGAGKTKAVKPADNVSDEIEALIRSHLEDDKLSCAMAWKIAGQLNLKKMDISFACETLDIRIAKCQLGAF